VTAMIMATSVNASGAMEWFAGFAASRPSA
jgi:hypothetical protein